MREAIDSALSQTYKNIEILVINDGSTDDTEEIALAYGDKIRYFAKENGGVATALNMGIENMRGEYFSWLSHDDMYHKDKIGRQIEALSAIEDKTTLVTCAFLNIDSTGKELAKSDDSVNYTDAQLQTPLFVFLRTITRGGLSGLLFGCSHLIHKSHFKRVGVFNTELLTNDIDLWFRIMRNQPLIYLREPLAIKRIHEAQDSNTKNDIIVPAFNAFWDNLVLDLTDSEIAQFASANAAICVSNLVKRAKTLDEKKALLTQDFILKHLLDKNYEAMVSESKQKCETQIEKIKQEYETKLTEPKPKYEMPSISFVKKECEARLLEVRKEYETSTSWKLTKPVRLLGKFLSNQRITTPKEEAVPAEDLARNTEEEICGNDKSDQISQSPPASVAGISTQDSAHAVDIMDIKTIAEKAEKIFIPESGKPFFDLGIVDKNLSGILSLGFSEEEIKSYMTDYYYDNAAVEEQAYDGFTTWQRTFRNALSLLDTAKLNSNATALELGAGFGGGTYAMQALYPNMRIIATELSASMLARHKKEGERRNIGADSKILRCQINADDLCFNDGSFDLIFGTAILHHVFDPLRIIEEAGRLLKPEGIAIFCEPFEPGYGLLRIVYETLLLMYDRDYIELSDAQRDYISSNIQVWEDLRSDMPHTEADMLNRDDKWIFAYDYFDEAAKKAGFNTILIRPTTEESQRNGLIELLYKGHTSGNKVTMPRIADKLVFIVDNAFSKQQIEKMPYGGILILQKGKH
jgi:glycosyltransferase involved in cell wall biosynthesis/ubiquinone/menaquinone biosynthesis C-methylase UbiE